MKKDMASAELLFELLMVVVLVMVVVVGHFMVDLAVGELVQLQTCLCPTAKLSFCSNRSKPKSMKK